MTDEDKKRIFKYMKEWKQPCDGEAEEYCITEDDKHTCRICEFYHPLDGNDMVVAMNKMWPDDYKDFTFWMITYKNIEGLLRPVVMQPARFFELMSSWLKEKENENT